MFSLQMGFGASQVFDPLSQVQIPLMGQFLNLVAMLIFVNTSGFQKIFLIGVQRSFERMRAVDLVLIRSDIAQQVMTRLSGLFQDALVIAFPILGTLVLVYVTMGLLAKAAPQMNLLVLGFPISIGITFVVLIVGMPFLAEAISQFIDEGFEVIQTMYTAGQDAAPCEELVAAAIGVVKSERETALGLSGSGLQGLSIAGLSWKAHPEDDAPRVLWLAALTVRLLWIR